MTDDPLRRRTRVEAMRARDKALERAHSYFWFLFVWVWGAAMAALLAIALDWTFLFVSLLFGACWVSAGTNRQKWLDVAANWQVYLDDTEEWR